jgi:hypothetical protein
LIGERTPLQLKSRTVTTTEHSSDKNDTENGGQPSTDLSTKQLGSAVAIDTSVKPKHLAATNPITSNKPNAVRDDEMATSINATSENTTKSEMEGTESTTKDADKASEAKSSAEKKEKIRREPDVINSRAAAFGAGNNSGVTKNDVCYYQHIHPYLRFLLYFRVL